MQWLRRIILALLALWGIGLAIGIGAHLMSDDLCSTGSIQATLLGIGVACLTLPFAVWRRQSGAVASSLSLFAGTCGAFVCTFLGIVPMESVFIFHPAIDTVTTPGFDRLAFLEIAPGMSESQVLELVGEPAARRVVESPGCRADFDQVWGYSRDGACGWCDAAWRSYTVYFRAGSVVQATELWHCD